MFDASASICRFSWSRPSAYQPCSVSQNAASKRSRIAAASRSSRAAVSVVAPYAPRELGDAQLRVVHVALHLDRRDRRPRLGAVAEDHRVVRVLPVLVVEPGRRAAQVLDEAVAVAVAGPSIHASARRALPSSSCTIASSPRPAPELREQDEEERRRVDGPVVAVGPHERRSCRAGSRARSFRARRRAPDRRRRPASRRARAARLSAASRPERQRLEARDQRVAAEQRHEPRQPGRRGSSRSRPSGAAVQRGRRPTASTGSLEVVARRLEPRHRLPPALERVIALAPVVAAAPARTRPRRAAVSR